MMRKLSRTLKLTSAALALSCVSMTASAALILGADPLGRADFTLGSASKHNGAFNGEVISFGQLTATTAGQVQFVYKYKEAGYTNTLDFTFGGTQTIFSTATASANQGSAWFDVTAGFLPFAICTNNGTSFDDFGRCVHNDIADSLIEQHAGNGFRSIGFLKLTPTSWAIFWDDSGASNDDDFDDLVAIVNFRASVPEPGTLALLGLGLLGVGLMRRRG